APGTAVSINAGDGDDTIALGDGNLASLRSGLGLTDVTVDGGGGTNTLILNDMADSFSQTYGISPPLPSRLVGSAPFLVIDFFASYSNVKNVFFNAGSGNNTFNISSTAPGTVVTIYGGPNNNNYSLFSDLSAQQGLVDIHGGGSTDTVSLDDS